MSSINEKLKAKRLENNISIEKIASELNIRKQYLIAIEEEDYSLTPGKVYTEGYIKLYANHLGIDFDPDAEYIKCAKFRNSASHLNKPYIESNHPSQFYMLMSIVAIVFLSYIWSLYAKVNNSSNNIIPSISFYNLQDRQFLKSRYDIIINSHEPTTDKQSLKYFLVNYPFLNEEEKIVKNKTLLEKEALASKQSIYSRLKEENFTSKALKDNVNYRETEVEDNLGNVTNNVPNN